MISITFDEYYQKYTQQEVITLDTGTVQDILRALFGRFPQLLVFFLDNHAVEASKLLLIYNDEVFLESTDLNQPMQTRDTLHFMCGVPEGAAGTIGTFVEVGSWVIKKAAEIGVISAETAAGMGQISAGFIGGVIVIGARFALGIMLSAIMGALADNVASPSVNIGSLENSATYTFTGIQNTTAAGTPIQVVYGRVRTGGHIISLFTDTTTVPYTYKVVPCTYDSTVLNYQIALCEGEVENISDVQVNKLPANYYDSVYTYPNTPEYFRTGTAIQSIMLDFSVIPNTTSIDRKIANVAGVITPAVIPSTKQTVPVYGYVTTPGSMLQPIIPTYGYFKLQWMDDEQQS